MPGVRAKVCVIIWRGGRRVPAGSATLSALARAESREREERRLLVAYTSGDMSEKPQPPSVVVLGGPNGAGKSTAAPRLLRGALRVDEFVNADTLAAGLSAFHPEAAALEAGRLMLRRLDHLAASRRSFACESTLASLALAKRLHRWRATGYQIHVVFLWLPDVDLALARVRLRVLGGGHNVPPETIARRFERGRRNFFERYTAVANTWRLYDATGTGAPSLVATGSSDGRRRVLHRAILERAVGETP